MNDTISKNVAAGARSRIVGQAVGRGVRWPKEEIGRVLYIMPCVLLTGNPVRRAQARVCV